jgi:D-glycero-D-manno-heptose 1,7-bisphosphate phosphatase
MSKALFLDRDGTLIIDKDYLADPAGVVLLPGVVEGLRHARSLGYRLFLFTNQSGIGRGYYTLDDARRVNARMESMIGLPAPLFDDICIAPEAPDQPSHYRKPSPRFIQEMIAKHSLDPKQCLMVGDRDSDIEAGLAAGIRSIALTSGKLNRDDWKKRPFAELAVYDDFATFAASLT